MILLNFAVNLNLLCKIKSLKIKVSRFDVDYEVKRNEQIIAVFPCNPVGAYYVAADSLPTNTNKVKY